jgi:hypothetical protein
VLPDNERGAIERHLWELDRLGEDLGALDKDIAQMAIGDPAAKRLLTVTGVNLTRLIHRTSGYRLADVA